MACRGSTRYSPSYSDNEAFSAYGYRKRGSYGLPITLNERRGNVMRHHFSFATMPHYIVIVNGDDRPQLGDAQRDQLAELSHIAIIVNIGGASA